MILGDTERLRAISERLLSEPPAPSVPSPPERRAGVDAGADADAAAQ
jgi:hypothetical protein